MCRHILIMLLLVVCREGTAQQLLANGGFEDRNTCTEFKALCSPEAWFYIPSYVTQPKDSIYFEALSMGNLFKGPVGRNYIYAKLLCPLVGGVEYKISLWVNTPKNQFDHLDVWLGDREPGQRGAITNFRNFAFTIKQTNADSIKGSWTKYNYSFTAKGDERFLMLGNISGEGLDRSKVMSTNKTGVVMYYIDDVSLQPVNKIPLCSEYYAIFKQVYEQNSRHPSSFVDQTPLDTNLLIKIPAHEKEVSWVIVDTPPTVKKVINDTLIIPDVLFLFNSSKINMQLIKSLNAVMQKIDATKFKAMEITGHTDNKGTTEYNSQLSLNRANAIKDYILTKVKINPAIITVKAEGESRPIAGNETNAGRQKNRRVEIVLKH